MKKRFMVAALAAAMSVFVAGGLFAADAKAGTMVCVGLYSETSDGSVSYRVGAGAWTVIKLGDAIPAAAEIRVNVDRDWIELIPANDRYSVYELTGSDKGEVIRKVADILKGKARTVKFPKPSGSSPDGSYKDRLVVTQYLGRQFYLLPNGDQRDIKYGDVLELKGKVRIIGINNTITLMNAAGQVVTVIGPLKFDVEQVLTNKNLYQFLNVLK
jgi:hypothetical protein